VCVCVCVRARAGARGIVVRAAGWHAGNPGSITGRDGLYKFGCIPQRFESASAEILRYIKTLIHLLNLLLCSGEHHDY
jgi:hypothetical protein